MNNLWIIGEANVRRRERLEKGLGHAEQHFLKDIWFPAVGHFRHLYAEWEIVDLGNQYRYLDFAYMPGGCKGAIEIQGYSSHARDIAIRRFKDLCMKHSHLGLDGLSFPSLTLQLLTHPGYASSSFLPWQGVFFLSPLFRSFMDSTRNRPVRPEADSALLACRPCRSSVRQCALCARTIA